MKSYIAILVPKSAIPDHRALRNEVELASKGADSLWWWVESGDEIIFCFDHIHVAVRLGAYCDKQGIPFRSEWRKKK